MKSKFNHALDLEKKGDHLNALAQYALIAQEDPTFRPVLINMGSLYSRMGRIDDAMNCFQQAGKLGEDYLNWFNIGSIFYKKEKFKQAVISFERSRKLNHYFTLASLVTGLAYSRLNNHIAAEAAFTDVLQIEPDNKVALNALSLMYYETNQLDRSLQLCQKISSYGNENLNAFKLESSIYYKMGNHEKAAEILKTVKVKDAAFTKYDDFVKLLPVETFTDRYGTIENKIERLTEKSGESRNAEDYISLSLCHLLSGDTDTAIDTLFMAKK